MNDLGRSSMNVRTTDAIIWVYYHGEASNRMSYKGNLWISVWFISNHNERNVYSKINYV